MDLNVFFFLFFAIYTILFTNSILVDLRMWMEKPSSIVKKSRVHFDSDRYFQKWYPWIYYLVDSPFMSIIESTVVNKC
jgi:hypothetical protein